MGRLTDAILNTSRIVSPADAKPFDLTRTSATPGYIPPPDGTFVCPICKKDTVHEHSGAEVVDHRSRLAKRDRLHWHIEPMVKELANSTLYYPALLDGSDVEVARVQASDIRTVVAAHNRAVDELLGFTD